ncbi:LysM peptidoglycan-binding domain-containing protein [Streptomyces xiamenensis]|uniref:LysM peptidoglycan-binding domain-containing protein n=1 Tax=Streptomyces xiamenensis TaxID=408015 RepID=UPI0035DFB99E
MPPAPTRIPTPRRTGGVLRAFISALGLVALLAGPPIMLLVIGQMPDGVPQGSDLWTTGLEQALPVLLTLACWALWAYWVWCVFVEAVVLIRRGPARASSKSSGTGPRGLAATLLGGLLLLPAMQAGTAVAAAPVPISDSVVPQTSQVEPGTSTGAVQEHPVHRVGEVRETVWDIAQRYFGNGERVTEIRDLNARLGNPLPATSLEPGAVIYLPHNDSGPGPEPLYEVTESGKTVADIAREQLGSSSRAGDVTALNPGLAADIDPAGALKPGTVLDMPGDYRPSAADSPEVSPATPPPTPELERGQQQEPSTAEQQGEEGPAEPSRAQVTVERGDTLWALSEQHLGDPSQWTALYEENQQVIGDDPDLILPGQKLVFTSGAEEPQPTPALPEEAPGPTPDEVAPDTQEPGGGTEQTPGGHAGEEDDTPEEAYERPAEAPERGEAGADDLELSPSSGQTNVSVPSTVMALAGAGVMTAGILRLVARRRMLQQRGREPGSQIGKPAGRSAVTEQAARYVEAGDQVAMLRRALMTAAMNLVEAGRELPDLAAVVLTSRGATLHLTEPAVAIAPFTAAEKSRGSGATRQWTVAAGNRLIPDERELGDVEAPYPALVNMGRDGDGSLVLVDLEHVGAVQLTGPRRREMLRTLAAELAVSEIADHLELALVGTLVAPELEKLGIEERITRYEGIGGAVPVLRSRYQDQQAAMEAVKAEHLRQARLSAELDGAWEPLVIMADADFATEEDAETALNDLVQMVSTGPRAAAAVVTSGVPLEKGEQQPDGVWVLSTDPDDVVVVPGTDLRIFPEPLADEEYADLVQIAVTSLSGHGEPASDVAAQSMQDAVVLPPGPSGVAAGVDPDVAGAMASPVPVPDAEPFDLAGPDLMSDLAGLTRPVGERAEQENTDGEPGGPEVPPLAVLAPPIALDKVDESGASASLAAATEVGVPPAKEEAPMVRLLGAVDITGARGKVESSRRRTLLETGAWIALNPNAPLQAMNEALWPGDAVVDRHKRNPRISKLRSWLGRNEAGELYLPHGLYAFSDEVKCDWDVFQELVAAAGRASGPDAEGLLHEALRLVRGRPFAGIERRRYTWAEHVMQDMVSGVVDAAVELAEYHMSCGSPRAALWAATKGLEAAEESEQLHRIVFRAHHALRDREGLERAAARLDMLLSVWEVDMEDSTSQLLGELLDRGTAGKRR